MTEPTPHRPVITTVLWMAVPLVTLTPLILAELPHGADMLNHVARAHVLANLADDADLRRFYRADWSIIPNLAIDWVMLALMKVMTPYQAGRAFIGLAILLMFAGAAALRHQVTGRVGLLPLATALIAYGAPVAIGLANFTLGIGLVMLGIAAWLATRRWPWPGRLVAMGGIALALFFTHLMALGGYGLVIGVMRLAELWRTRRIEFDQDAVLAGQFVLPFLLWLQVKAPTHGTETLFGNMWSRVEVVATPVLFFNDFDLAVAAVLAVLLGWLVISRRATLAAVLVAPAIALTAISLLMPVELFGIWLTHVRFPLLVALLLIAGLHVRIEERPLRLAVIAIVVALAVLRLDKVNDRMASCDAKGQAFIAALDTVPRGTRMLPVIEPASVTGDCLFSGYWHMPSLAVIERSAMFPLMFVHLQPLAFQPPYRHLIQEKSRAATPMMLVGEADPLVEPMWNEAIVGKWRGQFDVIAWLHPETRASVPPVGLERIGGGDFFTLYRVNSRK